ncbi:MAG: peptidylprolyl isomerase [Terriglobales bacterium]
MRLGIAALTLTMAALGAGAMAQTAPAIYTVAFRTTNGNFTITVHRDWAPIGADRFYTLVEAGYYNGNAFFRVVPGFVVQWGLSPNPAVSAAWQDRSMQDDPVRQSNLAGRVSFAARGRNTRAAQVFVNLRPNSRLDRDGFAPFGEVTAGMEVVAHMASDYGELPPQGHGPDPRLILERGAAYLTRQFPRLDVIYSAALLGPGPSAPAARGPLVVR